MFRVGWKRIEERNILAPENTAKLRKALGPSNPDSIIFGFHYYYAGSRGCNLSTALIAGASAPSSLPAGKALALG